MDKRRVGVFDSGVGGLSVLREIQNLMPQESFIFLADQKNVPYGQKTQSQLEDFTSKIVNFLIAHDVKMVVIACNTATVYTVDYLRQKYSLPIVGVVPVVKKLTELTKNKRVGVLSTPATCKSPYLERLIDKYASGITVFNRDGGGLEELVEKGDLDSPEITQTLEEVLLPLKKEGIDSLALGCTHYPFLREKIQRVVGSNVMVLDSGGAVARQVKRILENNQQLSDKRSSDLYFTTGNREKFRLIAEKLLNKKLASVESIVLGKYDVTNTVTK